MILNSDVLSFERVHMKSFDRLYRLIIEGQIADGKASWIASASCGYRVGPQSFIFWFLNNPKLAEHPTA